MRGGHFRVYLLALIMVLVAAQPARSSPHSAFFQGEVALSNEIYYLQFSDGTVFGYYSDEFYPWLYHFGLGWEWVDDANDGAAGVYFYDLGLQSFLYTNPSDFPFFYNFNAGSWWYYYTGTSNPRYFYDFGNSHIAVNYNPPGNMSLSGSVRGGAAQNPVAGSSVTLYAAGSGYGAGAATVATTATDSAGGFSLTFNCPAGQPQLYLTVLGGNSGAGPNPAIGLMAALGPCGSQTTTVVVNELATVAAQWTLAQFSDSSGQQIGAPPSNSVGLANAAALALTNLTSSSGTPAPFWPDAASCGSGAVPINCNGLIKFDTIANVLAACVGSLGAGSTACASLFADSGVGAGANTLAAAHAIALHPAANVAALFALQGAPGSAPFQPDLASTPNDWTLALSYLAGGINGPSAIAIDAAGDAWVANDGGAVVKFAANGNSLSGAAGFTDKSLNHCFGIVADSAGNAWVTSKYTAASNGLVVELAPSGTLLSGAGYAAGGIDYPLSLAFDAGGNLWVPNNANASVTRNPQSASAANFKGGGLSFPVAAASDALGDVWTANFGNNSVTELASDGSPLSSSGGYTSGGLDGPAAIAMDAGGHAWVANYYGDSVTELTSSGAGGASGAPFMGGGLLAPVAVAIDGAGNVWVANYTVGTITALAGAQSATPGAPLSGASGYKEGTPGGPDGLGIDASGNLWAANYLGNSVTEFLGVAAPVQTPLRGPPVTP